MKSREELVGAAVLDLFERFDGARRHRHAHHRLRKTLGTAVEALALLSLAHQLGPTRRHRLALATAGGYLQHQKRKHRHGRR